MKRKLTIAMALINEPDILFLDEPTSGLDVQNAAILRETLRELNENGTTIFLTTHNIEEANIMCDRVPARSRSMMLLSKSQRLVT
jgi:ABC-2 type transport system ATP-binding protein